MRSRRGFTLIELMFVVAVFAAISVLGYSRMRAQRRNAGVAAAATNLQLRLEQLQFAALAEQVEHLLVIADVPNNDASQCGSILSSGCARIFHLRGPTTDWKLQSFDVASPGANVTDIVDEDRLGEGVKFHLPASSASLPAPFSAFASTFKIFDPDLLTACAGSRKCVAYRFRADGKVAVEPPDPASPPPSLAGKSGHAFALGSELTGQTGGARQLAILVSAPSGIVRTFTVP